MQELYSLENAKKFNWSSISGDLLSERVSHLEKYLVGQKILDAGCGGGAYVEFLSQKGLEVTGIDKYDEFLQIAREKGRLGNYIQGDVTNLPFPDKSFDCTYSFDVLEHVDDRLAIKELARVTTKRLIIAVPQKDEVVSEFGLTFRPYQDPTHLRYYTETSLKDLAQTVNCSQVEVIREGIIPFHSLFKEMFDYKNSGLSPSVFRPLYKFRISNHFLNKVVMKATDILLGSLLNLENFDNLFNHSHFYKQVNIGIAAIIDL